MAKPTRAMHNRRTAVPRFVPWFNGVSQGRVRSASLGADFLFAVGLPVGVFGQPWPNSEWSGSPGARLETSLLMSRRYDPPRRVLFPI